MGAPEGIAVLVLVTCGALLAGLAQLGRGGADRAAMSRRVRAGFVARPRRASAGAAVADRIARTPAAARVRARLDAAGLQVGASRFLAVTAVSGIALHVAVAGTLPPWLAVGAALGAVRGCWAWLGWRADRRREAFAAQLPQLARLLAGASSAGLALSAGIALAAKELGDPAGAELRRVVGEMEIGRPLADALLRLRRRMPSREVTILVTTLALQQRGGGDLVTALRHMAAALERRSDLRREVRTILSGALATSSLVAVLGVGSVVLLDVLSPGVLGLMAATPAGRSAMAVAAAAYACGFWLIRRTTSMPS